MKTVFLIAAFALAAACLSAEEEAFPPSGAIGLSFNVIGSDMGSPAYADPKTSGFDTISGSGLGAYWFINKGLRLHCDIDFQYNLYGYSNKDTSQVMMLGIASDLDFALLRSGRIMFYAGPFMEVDWITTSYYTYASSSTESVQGWNFVAGGVIGADYFASPQFSIGAYCPVTVRYVWTATTVDVQSAPREFNIVGLQGLYAVLSYYL